MINDPDIDLVTFTGSVSIGKRIAERVGYRRLVLELGGNDPLIVMADADLDRAARLAVEGATRDSQVVPFILSHPLRPGVAEGRAGQSLRNYDVFSALLNDVEA